MSPQAARRWPTRGLPQYARTATNSEDSGGASGWSIENFRYSRTNSTDDWSRNSLVKVQIQIKGFRVGAPTLTSNPATVIASGGRVDITFNEALRTTNVPPVTAFRLEADGSPISIQSVHYRSSNEVASLVVSPTIKEDQTVTVSYTDPTSGDDTNALQDTDGNDVASFTVTATNNSTQAATRPSRPSGLTASWTPGETEIDLAWTAPNNGGAAITGYKIEWSANGSSGWTELEATTGNADTTYSDTGLAPDTTRHYRVSAINSEGTSSVSNVAFATTGNTPATGSISISGTARVGETLTGMANNLADLNGLPENATDYSLQWVRIDGTTQTPISGATSNSYTLVAADAGKRVKVRVSFTDGLGFEEVIESAEITIRAMMPPATCPAYSTPTGQTQVWNGTVTVAAITSGSVTFSHGYSLGTGQGSLSNPDRRRSARALRQSSGAYPKDTTEAQR